MADRWLSRAERYRALAVEFLQRGYYPEACLFAQQAAEFLLKGRLIEAIGSRPYTRSVYHLVKLLYESLGRGLDAEVVRCAKYLTEQYVGSRYPDARMLEHDREDAEECIKCLEVVWNSVQKDTA
ncbi:MAG: HEPN domain-containing protein [Thermoproteus sp.]